MLSTTATKPYPDKHDDPVTQSFRRFYSIPLLKVITDYLTTNTVSENTLLLRLEYMSSDEKIVYARWIKETSNDTDYSKLSPKQTFFLGYAYMHGFFHKKNTDTAKAFFKLAMKEGDTLSELFYATLCDLQDNRVALLHYENAKRKHSARAHYCLAVRHGQETNLEILSQGIKLGDSRSKYLMLISLGIARGTRVTYHGMSMDEIAKEGETRALLYLGKMYEMNEVFEKAALYFRLAAERNVNDAKAALHELFLDHPNNDYICYQAAHGLAKYLHNEDHKVLLSWFISLVNRDLAVTRPRFFPPTQFDSSLGFIYPLTTRKTSVINLSQRYIKIMNFLRSSTVVRALPYEIAQLCLAHLIGDAEIIKRILQTESLARQQVTKIHATIFNTHQVTTCKKQLLDITRATRNQITYMEAYEKIKSAEEKLGITPQLPEKVPAPTAPRQ